MKIQLQGDNLQLSEISEISAANAHTFRDQVRANLPTELKSIEIDLAATSFVDSCGLGALIALHKTATSQNTGAVTIRLVNPTPSVQQLIELTQLHRLFEIQKR